MTDGLVFIGGGGVRAAPPADQAWYLAGTLDVPIAAVLEGFKLRVIDSAGEPPVNSRGEVTERGININLIVDDESAEEGGSGMDESTIVRVPVVLRLPGRDLLPAEAGIWFWEFSGDGIRELLPFENSGEGHETPAEA